jgi:hypothetical protein
MSEHTYEAESKSLDLVRDVQRALAECLNSLGGKAMNDVRDRFILYSGKHINVASEGYILLRNAARVDCSKLLVRPLIETSLRMQAIEKHPKLLYRVIFGERSAKATMLRALAIRTGKPAGHFDDGKAWAVFKEHCRTAIPDSDLTDAALDLASLARAAGVEAYYDTHYRIYCTFTHGALEAIVGLLDELSHAEDNRAVAMCTMGALAVLANEGGKAPEFESLRERLHDD